MSQTTESKAVSAPKPMTPLQEFWHYFKRNKGAVVGMFYIILMVLIAILAGVLAPHAPDEQFRQALLTPPVWEEGGHGSLFLARMMSGAIYYLA